MTRIGSPIQAGHSIRGRSASGIESRRRGLLAIDILAAALASVLAELAIRRFSLPDVLIAVGVWFASLVMAGTHASGPLRLRRQAVSTLIAATGLTGFISLILLGVQGELIFPIVFTFVTFVVGLTGRLMAFARMERVPVSLALIMDKHTLDDLWARLTGLLGSGYRVSAILDPDDPGLLEQMISVMTVRSVDVVVIAARVEHSAQLDAAIHICRVRGANVLGFEDLYEDLTGRCLNPLTRRIVPLPGSVWRTVGSRALDIGLGLAYLAIWPIGAGLGAVTGGAGIRTLEFAGKDSLDLTVKQFGPGRTGIKGIGRFLCWGPIVWAPSGWLLVTGKLAAVGPSPMLRSDLAEGDAWQLRQSVRPGITGWAVINGCPPGPDSLDFDLYYVRHRSFGFDLGIFLRATATPLLSWRALSAARPPARQEREVISPQALRVSTGDDLVSVVVPAYREHGHIANSLSMLQGELAALEAPFEIIVVSDGNTDGTETEASAVDGPITVIHYPENRGKGYAIRRGLAESRGTRIVFIDADMELHPQGIAPLLSLLDAGADVAIGSKRHPRSQVEYPLPRRVQSRVYQWLVRRLFGLDVTDTQTGIKAFRGDLLREAAPLLTNDGFAFDLELLVELQSMGAVIAEGPVTLNYRFQSTTTLNAAVDVLRETLRLWHRRRQSAPVAVESTVHDGV